MEICYLTLMSLFLQFNLIHCENHEQSFKLYWRPNIEKWTTWSSWSDCTARENICYSGNRSRKRYCLTSQYKGCFGAYIESEDCPKTLCEATKSRILGDTIPATYYSFISQECDVDIKFAVTGTRANMVPIEVKKYFQKFAVNFQLGYFNIKQLIGDGTRNLNNATKFCFEPYNLSVRDAKTITKFNRTTKSNLQNYFMVETNSLIAGVVIVISKLTKELQGMYFATKSKYLGYQKIYYKRWKGKGFDEAF